MARTCVCPCSSDAEPSACGSFIAQGTKQAPKESVQEKSEPNGRIEAGQSDVEGQGESKFSPWGEEDSVVVGFFLGAVESIG